MHARISTAQSTVKPSSQLDVNIVTFLNIEPMGAGLRWLAEQVGNPRFSWRHKSLAEELGVTEKRGWNDDAGTSSTLFGKGANRPRTQLQTSCLDGSLPPRWWVALGMPACR
jgi:hypothetical protein